MIQIQPCTTASDFALALQITKDYLAWLDMDLSFQAIDDELSRFPSIYGPPQGLFLLAFHDGQLAGGVGLRMFDAEVCEMKRLFVYDAFKRRGIGRRLCAALIEAATRMGYAKMRLDTLGRMPAAIRLYAKLGFKEIGSYRFNPDPTALYMELHLGRPG